MADKKSDKLSVDNNQESLIDFADGGSRVDVDNDEYDEDDFRPENGPSDDVLPPSSFSSPHNDAELYENEADNVSRDCIQLNPETLLTFEESMTVIKAYLRSGSRKKVYPPGATQSCKSVIRQRALRFSYNETLDVLWKYKSVETTDGRRREYFYSQILFAS